MMQKHLNITVRLLKKGIVKPSFRWVVFVLVRVTMQRPQSGIKRPLIKTMAMPPTVFAWPISKGAGYHGVQ